MRAKDLISKLENISTINSQKQLMSEMDTTGVSTVKILVSNSLTKIKQEAVKNRYQLHPSVDRLRDQIFKTIDAQYDSYRTPKKLDKQSAIRFMKESVFQNPEEKFKQQFQTTLQSLIKQLNSFQKTYPWLNAKPIVEPIIYLKTEKY